MQAKAQSFQAGQLSDYYSAWSELTSDQNILDIISGDTIEFIADPPSQVSYSPNFICRDHIEQANDEIQSLLKKGVIVQSEHEPGEFISPIFTVPKAGDKIRLILNLKQFNQYVVYAHFKMESIHSILNLVTPGCWMASLDLKDAYYSVKVHPDYQKYLKFQYCGQLFQYTTYANGLCSCPRRFTKLLKPSLSQLRVSKHIVAAYIDDLYLQSDSYEGCIETIVDTTIMFDNVGFVIHPEKSQFLPTQQLTFLGFVIDSLSMRVYLTEARRQKVLYHVTYVTQNTKSLTIEYVAKVIGYIVSSLPAVQYGALYYRWLEKDKANALKLNKGNDKANMAISEKAMSELMWWSQNITSCYNVIVHDPITATLYSDASLKGWGAAFNDESTGGQWSLEEANHHINYLEVFAAFLALRTYAEHLLDKHVKLMIDNTAAVGIINNMGTCHNDECHELAVRIWQFCIRQNIWLTAAHLPGSANVVADKESRTFTHQDTEWMLNPETLKKALATLCFEPRIDLFASRINNQCEKYCSYRPDPGAICIDAFSIPWTDLEFYCFPPFSCILKVLQKIKTEKGMGVMVVPKWPTQSWYPILTSIMAKPPVELAPCPSHLLLPAFPDRKHPLHKKTTLLVCLLSAKN